MSDVTLPRIPLAVSLDLMEAYSAAMLGAMRHLSAVFKGRVNRFGTGRDFQIHIDGACGEMAVAKALNTYNPLTINTYKAGADIGKALQVRTRSEEHYDLIVREDDDPGQLYALVTGTCPHYKVHGWISGQDAKRPEWLRNHGGHGPAWFVPKEALAPMSELPKEVL